MKPPKLYKKLTIFKDESEYALMALGNVIARAKTKRGIRTIANYRLKTGGSINEQI